MTAPWEKSAVSTRPEDDRTVLIGAAGTGTSFAIATRLRGTWGADVRIVGMDINPPELVTTSLLCDTFHQVPRADDPSFARILEGIFKTETPTTYLPILNDEIALASRLASSDRARVIDIVAPAPELAELSRDKLLLAGWLAEGGVSAAKTCLPENRTGPGPWFMKPRNGVGSHGTRLADTVFLRAANPEELEAMVLQEVCTPPEVTVDSFFDAAAGRGRALCRERLETKAGVCTKARVFENPELSDMAMRIGTALGQRGTICFQVMRAGNGWAVTDLNLRPGAGTAMTCAAGFDVLSAFVACRWGLPTDDYFPESSSDGDIIVTRQYAEFVMRA